MNKEVERPVESPNKRAALTRTARLLPRIFVDRKPINLQVLAHLALQDTG